MCRVPQSKAPDASHVPIAIPMWGVQEVRPALLRPHVVLADGAAPARGVASVLAPAYACCTWKRGLTFCSTWTTATSLAPPPTQASRAPRSARVYGRGRLCAVVRSFVCGVRAFTVPTRYSYAVPSTAKAGILVITLKQPHTGVARTERGSPRAQSRTTLRMRRGLRSN
jgi:hypothetical protein